MAHEVERSEWKQTFDRISELLENKEVEIDSSGIGMDDGKRADWTRLTGLCYDARGDVFEVSTPDHLHEIRKPQKICTVVEGVELKTVEVVDEDGRRHAVHFRTPLMLQG